MDDIKIVTSKFLVFYKRISIDNKIVMKNLITSEECEKDKLNIELLKRCRMAQNEHDLVQIYGRHLINDYMDRRILLCQCSEWEQSLFWQAEVETGTLCNFACLFCPYSVSPRKSKVMSMDAYEEIISELGTLKSMRFISLSSYNEPLLDPFFEQRIDVLTRTNFKLRLSTNASLLTEEIVQLLIRSNVVDFIKINIPSVDEHEYIRMTGTDRGTYRKVLENIDYAIDSGINVLLAVNGTKKEIAANYDLINQRYGERLTERPKKVDTRDRAGFLKNEYHQGIMIQERLTGFCFRPLTWLVISVDGSLCMCCNDYEQKYVYGNIFNEKLEVLIKSEMFKSFRKQVYGYEHCDESFICRQCEYMQRGKLFKRYNPLAE